MRGSSAGSLNERDGGSRRNSGSEVLQAAEEPHNGARHDHCHHSAAD